MKAVKLDYAVNENATRYRWHSTLFMQLQLLQSFF